MQSVIALINHYGYIILFIALVLELIALPLPGEFMMTYCGFLVYKSKMNWPISIFVATLGVILGITISYFVGSKLGREFFKRYGSRVHLGPERFDKVSRWFDSYGNKLLILVYFIPGIRHLTGYFSGIIEMPYKKFAPNAYFGALLWTVTFISLGKILGANWGIFHNYTTKYLSIGSLIIFLILIAIYAHRNHRVQIIWFVYKILNKASSVFISMRKVKAVIAVFAAAFLGFLILVIGIIQDYLSHEFIEFDIVVSYLIKETFTAEWSYFISFFNNIVSIKILIPLMFLIIIWIIRRSANRFLEIRFLLIMILGGEVLQLILRNVFRRIAPSTLEKIGNVSYNFPSNQSFMSVVAYGFFAYIIIYYGKKAWIRNIVIFLTLVTCIFSGLNPLFFRTEYPSDVYAGYIFGGLWLTLIIILLEVYRIVENKIVR